MSNQHDKLDTIEKYLDNQLNSSEKEKFEEELLKDTELKEEVRQHRLMIDGIKLHGRKMLLDKTKEWDRELGAIPDNHFVQSTTNSFKWYYLAAAISLIIVSVFVIYSRMNEGFDRVVAAHYEPYNYIPDIRRSDDSELNDLDEIYQNYELGRYAQVIDLINLKDESEMTDMLSFLQANAYQATGETQKAITAFVDLVNSDSIYATASKWYLALCFLSEKQPEKAMPLIMELKSGNNSYKLKAERLLSDLE